MHLKQIALWISVLGVAAAAPSPTSVKRQSGGSCIAVPNSQSNPSNICGASGTFSSNMPYHTSSATTVEACHAECLRDPHCKSIAFATSEDDPTRHSCNLDDLSIANGGFDLQPGGFFQVYDRGCRVSAGECLPQNGGFEDDPFVPSNQVPYPWTRTVGDPETFVDVLGNNEKGEFIATPFGSEFLKMAKYGNAIETFNQRILLDTGARYQLDYSYNFHDVFSFGGAHPENYRVSVRYCDKEIDSVTLLPKEAKNRWVTRRKIFKASGCADASRVLKLKIEVGKKSVGFDYIGTFGFDEIKISRA